MQTNETLSLFHGLHDSLALGQHQQTASAHNCHEQSYQDAYNSAQQLRRLAFSQAFFHGTALISSLRLGANAQPFVTILQKGSEVAHHWISARQQELGTESTHQQRFAESHLNSRRLFEEITRSLHEALQMLLRSEHEAKMNG